MKKTINKLKLTWPSVIFPYCAIAFCVFFTFYHSLKSEFIGDDVYRIYFNEAYFKEGYSSALTKIMPDRPLLMMVMFLNYCAGGINPFYFKLTSVSLHLFLGLMIFSFFKHFQQFYLKVTSSFLPLIFTLLFLVHPVNTQTLMSSIQAGVILSAIGIIGSILFFSKYILQQSRTYLLVSILFFSFGILSKPNIIILPFMLVLFLIATKQFSFQKLKSIIPFVLLCFVPLSFYLLGKIDNQTEAIGWYHYLLLQFRVIFFYFKLFFIPRDLHFFYEFGPDYAFYSWKTFVAFAGHLIIWLAAIFYSKFIKFLWLGVACIYLTLIPESSFFPIKHILFEHRTYLPYIFLCLTLLIYFNHTTVYKNRYFKIIVTVILIIFSGLARLRIDSVDTYQKWAIDEYQYSTSTESNNLKFLNNLYHAQDYPGGDLVQVKKIIEKIVSSHPKHPLYSIYVDIFSYDSSTYPRKKETLEKIANFLIENKISYSFEVRSNLLVFLERKLPAFFPNQLSLCLMLEPIFRSQISYFKLYAVFYYHQEFQVRMLTYLKSYYEKMAMKTKLKDDELARYFIVLEQLAYLHPEKVKEIFKQIDYFELNYPQYSKPIMGIRKKFNLTADGIPYSPDQHLTL